MDIAATKTALQHNQLQNQASMKVMNMAKDQVEQTGKQITKLLDSTQPKKQPAHPHIGHNLDVRA
ncbi:hypothetical protein JCM16358_19430 [Halanaerocella petrolearia]